MPEEKKLIDLLHFPRFGRETESHRKTILQGRFLIFGLNWAI
jgi:hypothetical protein